MSKKILVSSKPERFRRAGIEFTRAGVTLDVDALEKGQLEAIESEPLLSVSPAEEVETVKAPKTTKGAK